MEGINLEYINDEDYLCIVKGFSVATLRTNAVDFLTEEI